MNDGDDGGDGGDGGNHPQLRSLRAAWRSLPDEEPPERGLAELMAAARRQADAMAAVRVPWWRRAVAAMKRPPVLALASIAVLAIGVVVVTSRPKASVSPEPTPSSAPAPNVTSEPAPPAAPGVEPADKAPATAGAPPAAPAVENKPAPPKPAPPKPASPKPRPARHAVPRKLDANAPPLAEPAPAPAEAAEAPVDVPSTSHAANAAAHDDDRDEAAPATRAPVVRAQATGSPRRALVDQLLAECRAAAVRGDCESAKLIAQRIATTDGAYYSANVSTDAAIAKCLGK